MKSPSVKLEKTRIVGYLKTTYSVTVTNDVNSDNLALALKGMRQMESDLLSPIEQREGGK